MTKSSENSNMKKDRKGIIYVLVTLGKDIKNKMKYMVHQCILHVINSFCLVPVKTNYLLKYTHNLEDNDVC